MGWTPLTFKTEYPEFNAADDALVSAKLVAAARRVDPRRFADRTDDAVGLMAAHLIALSPFGQQARLASDKADTTYRQEFLRLAREQCGGPQAIGAPDGSWPLIGVWNGGWC